MAVTFTTTVAYCDGSALRYFFWGFITVLNDILVPQLKANFNLNYTQAMLVQFCFFMAYFVVSIPSGYVIRKLGYQRGIQLGLVISALGCFLLSRRAAAYLSLLLLALFVLAAGIAMMQVAANPFVSALGTLKQHPVACRLQLHAIRLVQPLAHSLAHYSF